MATSDSPLTRHQGAAVGPAPAASPAELLTREFDATAVTEVRHDLRRQAERSGLRDDALDDFVTAVNELVTNAVRHGGGRGSLRLSLAVDTLIADVSDQGPGFPGALPVTAGPPAADVPGGRGILLARLLTDTLMVSDGPQGVTVTVTRCLSAPSTEPDRS